MRPLPDIVSVIYYIPGGGGGVARPESSRVNDLGTASTFTQALAYTARLTDIIRQQSISSSVHKYSVSLKTTYIISPIILQSDTPLLMCK